MLPLFTLSFGQTDILHDNALNLLHDSLEEEQPQVTLSARYNRFILRSEEPIRYFVDREKHTIILPQLFPADNRTPLQENTLLVPYEGNLLVNVGEAFRLALSTDEYTLTIIRGEALAIPETPLGQDDRAPTAYFLSNTDPAKVAQLLKDLYSELPVVVDERQRALYIRLSPDDKALIDNLINLIDAPRPQVVVEAEILEVNQNMTRNLGINYSSLFNVTLTEAEGGTLTSLGPVTRSTPFSLSLGLKILKDTGSATTLARPRVSTLDGQEARISATQTFPIPLANSDNQTSRIQNITTGITLQFTPKISPDGYLEAKLAITVSVPTGISSGSSIPQYSTREAQTTVRVANGEAIVIGGLLEKRRLESVSKVPLLGDIPLLGELLFTQRLTDERETDLVIVVTPRIINMPDFSALQTGLPNQQDVELNPRVDNPSIPEVTSP